MSLVTNTRGNTSITINIIGGAYSAAIVHMTCGVVSPSMSNSNTPVVPKAQATIRFELVVRHSFDYILISYIVKRMSFNWSSQSAMRKLTSDLSFSVGIPTVASVTKSTTTHNPKTDAYRSCSNCGKHWNYHREGKCP